MKLSFGVIAHQLPSAEPYLSFMENAEKYGHPVHSLLLLTLTPPDPAAVTALSEKARVVPITPNNWPEGQEAFRRWGISSETATALLAVPRLPGENLFSFAPLRNLLLIAAALDGADALVFLRPSTLPAVLVPGPEGNPVRTEVDFAGAHLAAIEKGASITVGGYSGYSIFPPAQFPGMEELLVGLAQQDKTTFWQNSFYNKSLILQGDRTGVTEGVHRGNMGIRLSALPKIPPFFSPSFSIDVDLYAGSGEDTLLTFLGGQNTLLAQDIDQQLFRDIYDTYPKVPNLAGHPEIQEKFLQTAMGWLARNPFLAWLQEKDLKTTRQRQEAALDAGAPELIAYTSNVLFGMLPQALRISWNGLPHTIREYDQLTAAWYEFVKKSELK